jgi:glycosyltransferase involved in cell wall biosynthesis
MIYVIEPFLTSSHQHWLNLFTAKNGFKVKTFTLGGHHWKWRMHGAAITLAEKLASEKEPDHIIISDMCDVAVFKSLLPRTWKCPITLYFHENQLTFPWSPTDLDLKLERNNHYAFINFTSALAADSVVFNSKFHEHEFITALPQFLSQFPNKPSKNSIKSITNKSSVIPIHIHASPSHPEKWKARKPLILWNHRWEYDKNPEVFFKAMFKLKELELDFELAILGSSRKDSPNIFKQAKKNLQEKIIHFGFLENTEDYRHILSKAHICPVTSIQDFFGISALEAIAAGIFPMLPNRLVFPEHLSSTEHLYDSDLELEDQLINLISNWKDMRTSLGSKASHFSLKITEKYAPEKIVHLWEQHFKNEA